MTIKSAFGVAALAYCMTSGGPARAAAPASSDEQCEQRNPNPQLYPVDSQPFGVSMLRWSEDWWRWAMSVPFAQNPNVTPGANPDDGQHGPVFFVPGSFAANPSTAPTTYQVSRHQAIGYGVVSLFDDYPCPDPTFAPAPGQSLFDFLITTIKATEDTAQISGTLDGKPLNDLLAYHYVSDRLFYYTGDVSMQALDNCITGARQPAVSDSYFFIIKPMEPGRHVLVNTITTTGGTVFGPYTTYFDVQRD